MGGTRAGNKPGVFDELTGILLECAGWTEDGLAETEALFLRILNGFIRQNKLLHDELSENFEKIRMRPVPGG